MAPTMTAGELDRLGEALAVALRPVTSLARHAETGKLRRLVPLVPV